MAAMSAPERAQFLSRVLGYERIRAAQERLQGEALGAARAARRAACRSAGSRRAGGGGCARARAARPRAGRGGGRLHPLRGHVRRCWPSNAPGGSGSSSFAIARSRSRTSSAWRSTRGQSAAERAGRLERPGRRRRGRAGAARRAVAPARAAASVARRSRPPAPAGGGLCRAPGGGGAARRGPERNLARLRERIARVPAIAAVTAAEHPRRRCPRGPRGQRARCRGAAHRLGARRAGRAHQAAGAARPVPRPQGAARAAAWHAGPDGVCPTCARPLGGEFANVLGVLDRQLEDVLFNGNFYKQRIEQLQPEPPELLDAEHRRLALEAELAEASADLVRLTQQVQDGAALERDAARLTERAGGLEAELARLPSAHDQATLRGGRAGGTCARAAHAAGRAPPARRRAGGGGAGRARRGGGGAAGRRGARGRARRAGGGARIRRGEPIANRVRRSRRRIARGGRRSWRWCRPARRPAAAAEALSVVARRRAERATREAEAQRTAGELALHQELDRALGDLRTELNAHLRPDLSDLASGFLADLTRGRYAELELDDDYVATLLDDGDPKTGDLRRRGRRRQPRAPPRHQPDDRRAGGPAALAAGARRDLRLARRGPAHGRGGAAPEPGRPLPAGHPHHPHRVGAGRIRSRGSRGIRRRSRSRRGAGRRIGRGRTMWRPDRSVRGPERATPAGRRSAQPGVRRSVHRPVQPRRARGRPGAAAQPAIWRYAIEDAGDGAMVWRDTDGQLAGFNMVHRSGAEGWMGPIAVRPDRQNEGLGSTMVQAGIDWLKAQGARTIGLETMPRTVDNIGFYSRLGFMPGHLTITLVRDVGRRNADPGELLSAAGRPAVRAAWRSAARSPTGWRRASISPASSRSPMSSGSATPASSGATAVWSAFALWHSAPLGRRPAQGRGPGAQARC